MRHFCSGVEIDEFMNGLRLETACKPDSVHSLLRLCLKAKASWLEAFWHLSGTENIGVLSCGWRDNYSYLFCVSSIDAVEAVDYNPNLACSMDKNRLRIYGFSDSDYQNFNFVAKKLDRRILDLGATPIVERGLGDDQHPSGYEAVLDPWMAS
ncbi:hypothetical protein ACLB2K_002407 [Fragaria x ananassa]